MTSSKLNYPDKEGFFGEFGGKFVPETHQRNPFYQDNLIY